MFFIFYIMSKLAFIIFDVLSHSAFFPFNVFSYSAFFLFNVFPINISYYSAFCPSQRFFHSTFCPSQRFFHLMFGLNRGFVLQCFLPPAFFTSTFCRWTMYLTLPLLDHTVPTWLSYCISPSPYLFSSFLSIHPVSNHPLVSIFSFILFRQNSPVSYTAKNGIEQLPFIHGLSQSHFWIEKNVPLSFLHGPKCGKYVIQLWHKTAICIKTFNLQITAITPRKLI